MQNEGKCAAAGLRQEWILIMDEARTGALKRAVAIREKAAGAGPDALLREVMEAAKAEGFAGCYPLCAVRESVGLLQGCFLFLILCLLHTLFLIYLHIHRQIIQLINRSVQMQLH